MALSGLLHPNPYDIYCHTVNGSAIPTLIGDVVGPIGSTADHIAVFDNATGKLLRDSGMVLLGGAGTLSGNNSGDVTLGAVGAVPNANGASLTGQVLALQPADGTNPGCVSTVTQTIAGDKFFSGGIRLNAASIPGNVTLLNYYESLSGAAITWQGGLFAATASTIDMVRLDRKRFINSIRVADVGGNVTATIISSAAALPAYMTPTRQKLFTIVVINQGVPTMGTAIVRTTGFIEIGVGLPTNNLAWGAPNNFGVGAAINGFLPWEIAY